MLNNDDSVFTAIDFRQEGKAEPVFERAVKQLPFAARIWAAYGEWCEMQAPRRFGVFFWLGHSD